MTQTIRQIVLSLPGNLSHKLTCILYTFERRNELKLHTRCLGHARLQSHGAVSQPRTTNPFPAWPVVTQRCFTCILMAAGPARTLVVKQVENVGIYSDVRILFKSKIHKQGRRHIYSERTSCYSCWGWASSRSRSSVGFGCNVSWFTLDGWYLFAMWRKGVDLSKFCNFRRLELKNWHPATYPGDRGNQLLFRFPRQRIGRAMTEIVMKCVSSQYWTGVHLERKLRIESHCFFLSVSRGELHQILKLGIKGPLIQCASHVASCLQEMSITPQEVAFMSMRWAVGKC